MEKWRDGEMEGWRNGGMEKCLKLQMPEMPKI
jgi:hypothetical protein